MKIEIHSWKEDDTVVEQLDIDGNAEFTIASPDAGSEDSLISCEDILEMIRRAHQAGMSNSPLEVSYNNQISA
jgi:hypothetical protein